MVRSKDARLFHGKSKKKSGSKAVTVCTTWTYTDAVADALTGKRPKDVAAWADVSPRVAENWISGENGPSGTHLVRLMTASDDVFEKIMGLTGRMSGASLSPAQREAVRRALAILAGD